MARIPYYEIENEIAEILRADEELQSVNVTVEDVTEMEAGAWIGIYLLGRTVPPDGQPLAAGTRTRFRLDIALWCWEYSLDSMADAVRKRDDLVGKVELTLMANRTFNNLVNYSFLNGGELQTAQLDETAGFIAGGEILVQADITASTT